MRSPKALLSTIVFAGALTACGGAPPSESTSSDQDRIANGGTDLPQCDALCGAGFFTITQSTACRAWGHCDFAEDGDITCRIDKSRTPECAQYAKQTCIDECPGSASFGDAQTTSLIKGCSPQSCFEAGCVEACSGLADSSSGRGHPGPWARGHEHGSRRYRELKK